MSKRIYGWIGAIAIVLAAGLSVARAGAAQEVFPSVSQRVRDMIAKGEVPGAVTLVANRSQVLHFDCAGARDVESGTRMHPDTIFWIASMTKPVTGVAVMMLLEEGKLQLDDPVSKYIPELANVKTGDGEPNVITLKHLLTHTSGLSEPTPDENRRARTLAELIPFFANKPLAFKPGAKWQYSQSGINSLGRVVEIVSGESLPDFLEHRLFGPLGMKDTTFYPNGEQMTRLAKAYKCSGGKFVEDGWWLLSGRPVSSKDRYPAANGGLFSTAADYARFCRMLLNDGTLDGRHYLSPETVRLMTSVHTGELKTGFTEGNGWGLGCCVVRQPQGVTGMLSPGTFGHGGAYGTQAWIDPVKGIVYVLMVQRSDFPNSDASELRKTFQEAAAGVLSLRASR